MTKKVKFEMYKAFHTVKVYEKNKNKIIQNTIYRNAWIIFEKTGQPYPDVDGNYIDIDIGDEFEFYDVWSSDTEFEFQDKKLERKVKKLLEKAENDDEDLENVLEIAGFDYETKFNIITEYSGTLEISDI